MQKLSISLRQAGALVAGTLLLLSLVVLPVQADVKI